MRRHCIQVHSPQQISIQIRASVWLYPLYLVYLLLISGGTLYSLEKNHPIATEVLCQHQPTAVCKKEAVFLWHTRSEETPLRAITEVAVESSGGSSSLSLLSKTTSSSSPTYRVVLVAGGSQMAVDAFSEADAAEAQARLYRAFLAQPKAAPIQVGHEQVIVFTALWLLVSLMLAAFCFPLLLLVVAAMDLRDSLGIQLYPRGGYHFDFARATLSVHRGKKQQHYDMTQALVSINTHSPTRADLVVILNAMPRHLRLRLSAQEREKLAQALQAWLSPHPTADIGERL
jgi:hypothetical protein